MHNAAGLEDMILFLCFLDNGFLLLFSVLVCHTGADLSDADLRSADFSLANVTKVVTLYSF